MLKQAKVALRIFFFDHWRYLLRHWFPLILLGVVWAFIAGWIGASFGVPLLFRDDPAYDYKFAQSWLNRPSIAGYTAATVLLAAVLAVVYILEIIGMPPKRTPGKPMLATIRFFAIAGAAPLVALVLAATFPSFDFVEGTSSCDPAVNSFCLPGGFEPSISRDDPASFHPWEGMKALTGILLGSAIAFVLGTLIFLISTWVAWTVSKVSLTHSGLERWLGWVPFLFSGKARDHYPLMIGTGLSIFLTTGVLFFVSNSGISLAAIARPAAAICIFFGFIVVFYFFILLLAPSLRFIGVIAFFAYHAFIGVDRYINEFPGFKMSLSDETEQTINYYDCLLPLSKSGKPAPAKDCKDPPVDTVAQPPQQTIDHRPTPPLLSAEQWAEQWISDRDQETPKKLVIIATQGGAYRASFWTSLILDELVKRDKQGPLSGLIDRVGLLTGASGGMVGAAYFTVMSSTPKDWYRFHHSYDCGMNGVDEATWAFGPITSKLCLDIFISNHSHNSDAKFPSARPIARDSLTPLAAQTIFYDIPRVLLWPLTDLPGLTTLGLDDMLDWDEQSYHDRGLILERQWQTLHTSYGALARQQAALRQEGRRHPSMIISPMMADTGQPILVSNLDLDGLINGSTQEAVSLFDWFPDIREDFRVNTAVRMNATFPYISPAASLPTTVRRRVVDAGYYDNYGVNTAVSWLFQDEILDVIANEDSGIDGIVFIQIRAFPGRDQGQEDADPSNIKGATPVQLAERDKEAHKPDLPLVPEWMTSPLAGVLSARSGSMAYRNDAQIDRLKKLFMAKGRPADFVQSITFENHADPDLVGVSWHITPAEMAKLESELKSPWNCEQFKLLEAFWQRSFSDTEEPSVATGTIVEAAYMAEPAFGPTTDACPSDIRN